MQRRTHNLLGVAFCAATAVLLAVMTWTGFGDPPDATDDVTQRMTQEAPDHRG